jgi:hypothetical protein
VSVRSRVFQVGNATVVAGVTEVEASHDTKIVRVKGSNLTEADITGETRSFS